MKKLNKLRVLVIIPKHEKGHVSQCARMNDILNCKEFHDGLDVDILSLNMLSNKKGLRKLLEYLEISYKSIRRVDLIHFVYFPPFFLLLYFFSLDKMKIFGPNITATKLFPRKFYSQNAQRAFSQIDPYIWRKRWFTYSHYKDYFYSYIIRGKICVVLCEMALDILKSRVKGFRNAQILKYAAPKIELTLTNDDLTKAKRSVFYIGRLDSKKGFDTYISVTKTLKCDAAFDVFGSGPLISSTPTCDERYCCWGQVSRKQILQQLNRCTVYFQPSTYDPVATTILESLRAGVPVLAADIVPNKELAKKFKGIVLYDQNDEADATLKLTKMLKSAGEYKQLATIDSNDLTVASAAIFLKGIYNEATQ